MISGCFFSDISRMILVYMGTMGVQSRIKDIATSFSYLMPKMALSYKRYTQHKNKNVPGRRVVSTFSWILWRIDSARISIFTA